MYIYEVIILDEKHNIGIGLPRVKPKKTVEIIRQGKPVGVITLWEDNRTTVCLTDKEDMKGGCYTSIGDKMFYLAQAWAKTLSKEVEIKPVE